MKHLHSQYESTVAEFKDAPNNEDVNIYRMQNFIQGMRLFSNSQIFANIDSTTYTSDGVLIEIKHNDLPDFSDKDSLIQNVYDQIIKQMK